MKYLKKKLKSINISKKAIIQVALFAVSSLNVYMFCFSRRIFA